MYFALDISAPFFVNSLVFPHVYRYLGTTENNNIQPLPLTPFFLRIRHEGLVHQLRSLHSVLLLDVGGGGGGDGGRGGHNLEGFDHSDVAQFLGDVQRCLPILRQRKIQLVTLD